MDGASSRVSTGRSWNGEQNFIVSGESLAANGSVVLVPPVGGEPLLYSRLRKILQGSFRVISWDAGSMLDSDPESLRIFQQVDAILAILRRLDVSGAVPVIAHCSGISLAIALLERIGLAGSAGIFLNPLVDDAHQYRSTAYQRSIIPLWRKMAGLNEDTIRPYRTLLLKGVAPADSSLMELYRSNQRAFSSDRRCLHYARMLVDAMDYPVVKSLSSLKGRKVFLGAANDDVSDPCIVEDLAARGVGSWKVYDRQGHFMVFQSTAICEEIAGMIRTEAVSDAIG